MKKLNLLIIALFFATIYYGCKKKDDTTIANPTPPAAEDNYTSMAQFHSINGVQMQTHIVDAVAGGSFTTPQGTLVSIPANAFKTQGGLPVTGLVTIQFKDIYKKSDMLLSDKGTQYWTGIPLKSGGEFFIKAMQANVPVKLVTGEKISVTQPLNGLAVDTAMKPMVIPGIDNSWAPPTSDSLTPYDSINIFANTYVFSLYSFNNPLDSGTWCNSDNPNAFTSYPQTTLTLHGLNSVNLYSTEVYLLFNNLNCMIHVYGGINFPYYYAPLGVQCTAVAVGVSNGKLFSSFVPITITSNLTVNFTLSQTTATDFKAALAALN